MMLRAANGDPNSANNAVSWPAYTQADDSNIRMDIPVSTESGLKKVRRLFLLAHVHTSPPSLSLSLLLSRICVTFGMPTG